MAQWRDFDSREAYTLFDTAFGLCGLAWSADGITRLQLPERTRAATAARLCRGVKPPEPAQPTPPVKQAIAQLQRYFDGEPIGFTGLELDLAGVPDFHARVYGAMRALDWGETTTYGALADEVGSPGAARAIGQAMARNPIPIIVPCHRVLAGGRRIGGFSAPGGATTKERLLAMEGVRLGGEAPLLDLMASDRA